MPAITSGARLPLLTVPVNIMLARAVDVVWLTLPYDNLQTFNVLTSDQQGGWLMSDAAAAMAAALSRRKYRRLTVLGHSLGTVGVAHLMSLVAGALESEAIWFSPICRNLLVREGLQRTAAQSLIVVGTADDEYDPAFIDVLIANAAQIVVVPDANAYMEVTGAAVLSRRP
ncbi:MAG: hypothetical protein M3082_18200, partial [Candidatus Dormibacteraeota bacterium]|nr:hypothetical protein [Candidatus Dormibacteraeota bacterium]